MSSGGSDISDYDRVGLAIDYTALLQASEPSQRLPVVGGRVEEVCWQRTGLVPNLSQSLLLWPAWPAAQ